MAKPIREPFNTVSHLVGAIVVGIGVLGLCIAFRHSPIAWISFMVFGLGSVFLYSSSAAYHWTENVKPFLQRLDHAAIFVMIAASYTPVALLALDHPLKWWVLGIEWGVALVGLLWTLIIGKPPTAVRLVLYTVLGWLILPWTREVLNNTSLLTFALLLLGGLSYTIGILFYARKTPWFPKTRIGNHEVWHVFVLVGTVFHYAMCWSLPA